MNTFFDYPKRCQLFFQDSASPVMEGVIDFHHDLTGILIWIGLFVLWMTFSAVRRYYYFLDCTWREYTNQNVWDRSTLPSLKNHGEFIRLICTVYSTLSAVSTKLGDLIDSSRNFFDPVKAPFYKLRSQKKSNINQTTWVTKLGLPIVHHTTLEIIWTLVPAFILMGIAVPSFALLYAMDELVAPLITVKVIGRQWYWQYEYSDHSYDYIYESRIRGDASNDWYVDPQFIRMLDVDKPIVLPQRVHVRLLITAGDVLHSFAVPSLGLKLDACPGRLNQTALYAKRVGVFYGQCSEICGINHAFMPIVVNVVSFEEYIRWYLKHKPILA